jgi:putative ABC transport system permease protein
MLQNYLKIALRNLSKNRVYASINIGGLAVGMAVAMLIGLWVWDELNFNQSFSNKSTIARVMQSKTFNGTVRTNGEIPIPLGNELQHTYGSYFQHVLLATSEIEMVLHTDDKKIMKSGMFIAEDAPSVFSMNMISGDRNALKTPQSMLLSETLAKALFGSTDVVGKVVTIINDMPVTISGVFEDFPFNSTFKNVNFLGSWAHLASFHPSIQRSLEKWENNGWQLFVQIAPNTDFESISAKIKDVKKSKIDPSIASYNPEIQLQPMAQWYLYSEYKEGKVSGGRIQYVWMFGIIGFFVLFLACINFMNLSTARSEKRAKETGIRKAVGSGRPQLIAQYLTESVLVAFIAMVFALVIVHLALPLFNTLADKQMIVPYLNPLFSCAVLGFTLVTGLLAGTYPAFYLSSFSPLKVLKGGGSSIGKMASLPRKVLVAIQFTVSIVLIISTIIVYKQIQFTQDRVVGYNRDGLLTVESNSNAINEHFDAIRNDLLNSGVVVEAGVSSSPATEIRNSQTDFEWKGKPQNGTYNFCTIGASQYFGKTIGWEIIAGKDYETGLTGADAQGLIINETAQKTMGLKDAVGETVKWNDVDYRIIGVVKDMVMESPYQPINPTIIYMSTKPLRVANMRLKPNAPIKEAITAIEGVFQKYNPSEPFVYKFSDAEYAKKFDAENRISNLSLVFALLAIFISCLGLFALAAFMAEQRTKEIGVRKVLGASVFSVWGLLSKEFVGLVVLSCILATPVAYYYLNNWLQQYEYRTAISWWVFVVSGVAAIAITLMTVSFQAIRAALANPVKSLRSE